MLQKRKAEESEEGELGDPDMMGFLVVFGLFTYLTNVAEEEGGGE